MATSLREALGYSSELAEVFRHLPGKHDQKTHGRKGGQAALRATNKERLEGLGRPGIDDDPEIVAAASAKFEEALTKEAEITSVLGAVKDETGAEFQHFGERVKYESSIRDKIYRERQSDPSLSVEQAAANITDTNRYTLMWEADGNYRSNHARAEQAMNDAGWKTVKSANAWAPGDGYDGMNYKFQKGNDVVEVQFHTPGSARIKDESHILYSKARTLPDGPEKAAYGQQINSLWNADRSHVPPNMDDVGVATWYELEF